ncbi:MAG: 1-(5-phosphoribosyl)-5-[(5-phosphoribosylamino)methylideneamino]imidazole-4-carboxamide isomerase [Alphaproteobacteria bacterium]|nr:1-(5-phosphoribosyl)-5-[(5-phosphoribosylamino)methylideneamino]imidazole-4-carboxamide isomerase [Alphaproteobacteria bacterium]MCD8570638.1 1-(5-phosphoribosyl)-5-[(5-phosphoribosylamino)methylideneamino]imidazole-4-carboxamide isomerase [Alphaproteobacteria bacterium]
MIIYPAIDLKDGKCVRLYKGDMTQDTVYNDDPAAQAFAWVKAGFNWLHIVDLNGAIEGAPVNQHAVRQIIEAVDIPVQLGGGIRTHAQIEHWLQEGVSRVILGTAAVQDPDLVIQACRDFPGQIAVGIDALGGEVMTHGWVAGSNINAKDLAREFEDAGVCAIIYTDIDRDGTGKGINMEATIELADAVTIPVIASGGAHSLDDIRAVKAAEPYGVSGMIIGKAFYEGTIDPLEALKTAI